MFSGAGGLDMGFHNKGFDVLWANDFSRDACDTYDLWANYNKDGTRKADCTVIECGDIRELDLNTVLPGIGIDVVLGGFPCQGFSLGGPRQVDDSRNILYRHFVEMVRLKKPKVIVAENVIGIKTLGGGAVFEKIIEDFSVLGYRMSAPTLNAKDFGVPQDRMRVVFIGIREDICHDGAYYFPKGTPGTVTLREALADLGPVDMEDVCQAPFSSRYMSRNRKRGYGEVSFTIPAMAKQVPLSPDSDGMEYVDVDQFKFIGTYNRRLSYKEAAAIQTFPKGMVFCGDLDSKYMQIGNAVPVKLAEAIAGEVNNILTTDNLVSFLNTESPEKEIVADRRINSTVLNGKAFEYAMLSQMYGVLVESGWQESQIRIKKDKNYCNAEKAYQVAAGPGSGQGQPSQSGEACAGLNDFDRAARAGAGYICKVEPVLQCPDGLCAELSLMPDIAGVKGDVRDVSLAVYKDAGRAEKIKDIGISCKNNHEAVKHPRITEDPDFARVWTDGEFKCSDGFISKMKGIFGTIDKYAGEYRTWSEVEEKHDTVYYPIVSLFVEEIRRLGMAGETGSEEEKASAKRFAQKFFEYMFGTRDFYKMIKEDRLSATKVFPYDMHGTLMKDYGGMKNKQAVKCFTLPEEIVEVRMKPDSKTTMEIYFDQWIITMRLHNADKLIRRTALKFDVQIKAQPRKIMGSVLPWA